MLWDVRSAKGCLRTFDQHNGDTAAGPKSGYLCNPLLISLRGKFLQHFLMFTIAQCFYVVDVMEGMAPNMKEFNASNIRNPFRTMSR